MIFDGRTYVRVPHCDAYNVGNGEFTIEARIKADKDMANSFAIPPSYNNMTRGGGIFAKRTGWHNYNTAVVHLFVDNNGKLMAVASSNNRSWDARYKRS